MPSLALGAGIARGAQAFVASFMQGKQYEQQQKMQKNGIILQALFSQLQDDNIPYSKRAQIIDSIPNLIGAKIDVPLSHQFGLHDLLDDDVTVEEGKPGVKETKGTPASTITDSDAVQEGLAGTVGQQATQSTEGIAAVAPKTIKMGDLSPAKYKQLLRNQQEEVDTNRELEKTKRIAEINFDLQQKSYKAQGYTKELARGIDTESGEYRVLLSNSEGDVKVAKMPKGFVPLEILVAQAKGQSAQLPAAVRAYKAYFEGQTNPLTGAVYTDEEAKNAALELYKTNGDAMFGLTKAQKAATVTKTQQDITGTSPESPHEAATRQNAEESIRIQREGIWAGMESQAVEAEGNVSGLSSKVSAQQQIVDDLQKGFDGQGNDDSIASNYSKGDPEYEQALNELNRQKRALTDMQADLNGAKSKATALRQKSNTYKNTIGDASTSGLTGKQQAAVNIVKANPKNKDVTAGKSDVEIWAMIQAQSKRK